MSTPSWWAPSDRAAVRGYFDYQAARDLAKTDEDRTVLLVERWCRGWHSCRTCQHWMSDQGAAGDCMSSVEERGHTDRNDGCRNWAPRCS